MDAPGEPNDRGETLLELLIAMVILSLAVVALLGAVATGIRMADVHRGETLAGSQLRAFEEALQAAIARSPSAYAACATTASYGAVYVPTDGRYLADVTAVRYWDGSAFGTACTAATDTGLQRVSLRVRDVDSTVMQRNDVVIRRPCRPVDPSCS